MTENQLQDAITAGELHVCSNPFGPDQGEGSDAVMLTASEIASEEAARKSAWDGLDAKKSATAEDWDAVYRAAVCAAAEAITQRDWNAKRQALAVAEQADAGRDIMVGSIFGARPVPQQYAGLLEVGRTISRVESSVALKVIAVDRATQSRRRTQLRKTA